MTGLVYWQHHLKGTHDEDADEDTKGGFGVGVSSHLERQDDSLGNLWCL